MDRRGLPSAGRPAATGTLLALAAARQASSATSMAQARLAGSAEPPAEHRPTRVALFAAGGRSPVRGSFDPQAAAMIEREGDR